MILNSIKLENIRSYHLEEIEFPRGITLFEGDIGSGKSSVLMGIEFALFGLGSQKPEALLSKKEEQGSVTLRFSVDDDSYEIKRVLRRKGDSVSQDPKNCYLKVGDVVEPLAPSELKQRVLQILKFNEPADPRSESRIFRYAFFTPQEEMKQILLDTSKRLETIRKAFGVEDYKIVAENAKLVATDLKLQMARFEERFRDVKQLEDSLEASKKKMTQLDLQLKEMSLQQLHHESQKQIHEKELEKLRSQEREKLQLETQIEILKEKISDVNAEIVDLQKSIASTSNDLKEINEKIHKLSQITRPTTKTVSQLESELRKFQEMRVQITRASSKIDSLQERKEELKKMLGSNVGSEPQKLQKKLEQLNLEINELKPALEKAKDEVESLKEKKIAAETQKNNLEVDLAKISKLGSKCPYCENQITKDHLEKLEGERKAKLADIQKEITSLASMMSESKQRVVDLQRKIDKATAEASEVERIMPNLEEWAKKGQELERLREELNAIRTRYVVTREASFQHDTEDPVDYVVSLKDALIEYQNAQTQIRELESSLKKTERLKEKYESNLASANQKLLEFDEKTKQTLEKLKSFSEIDAKSHKLKSQITEIDERISRCKASLAAINENLKNEKLNAAKLENDVANAKKWQAEHQKYGDYYEWLQEFFIPALDQIEKQVLLSIQQQFNETYRRWYSILIEDPTKESKIDENFTPLIEQDGYELDVDFLSGGEKTSIALAYRLTLNSLMRKETQSMKSNLLILDEPTDGFSKTQLSKVKDVLQELNSEQIILVSHEKELETYVDNIFQISKEGGVSRITRLSN
ncbi:MAG TPA: SMC family ATPase [Candidatus Nitrosotenuis sp.]|nr:SMC family ATPase [Candidatus Nitrosotenuis sp.]